MTMTKTARGGPPSTSRPDCARCVLHCDNRRNCTYDVHTTAELALSRPRQWNNPNRTPLTVKQRLKSQYSTCFAFFRKPKTIKFDQTQRLFVRGHPSIAAVLYISYRRIQPRRLQPSFEYQNTIGRILTPYANTRSLRITYEWAYMLSTLTSCRDMTHTTPASPD